jgi:hypothetical protein
MNKSKILLSLLEAITNYQDFDNIDFKTAKEEFKKHQTLDALKGMTALPMRVVGSNKFYFVEIPKNSYIEKIGVEVQANSAAGAKAKVIYQILNTWGLSKEEY